MPLLASSHAALETGDESNISIFLEDIDDLLLGSVGHFHFVLRGHTPIYVMGSSEPGFQRICGR